MKVHKLEIEVSDEQLSWMADAMIEDMRQEGGDVAASELQEKLEKLSPSGLVGEYIQYFSSQDEEWGFTKVGEREV